jgi:hypothetical protein
MKNRQSKKETKDKSNENVSMRKERVCLQVEDE